MALDVSLTCNKAQLKDAINAVINDVVQNGSVSKENKSYLYDVAWENIKLKTVTSCIMIIMILLK